MGYYGDYHTHTTYSHGKGRIEDNVRRAVELGLKEIAITDHGLSHIAFGLNDDKVMEMRESIEVLKAKYPMIEIYLGVEANIIGLDGTIDLIDEEFDWFDVILMGYHKFVWPARVSDYFRFFTPNYFYDTFRQKAPPHVVARNTDAFVKAVEKWPIDVVTHVNHGIRVDCRAIAQAAKEHGTYIELNGKHITFSDEEFLGMAETGVRFIMDSDAHSVDRITDFGPALALLERTGYPKEEIAGFCTKPDFRSVRERRGRTSRLISDE